MDVDPIFIDCYDPTEPDEMVPSILSPLKPHPRDGPGRMVEEWQLAAHKKTKRILVRAATRTIAKTLEEKEASRIFVHGRRGVGKVRTILSHYSKRESNGGRLTGVSSLFSLPFWHPLWRHQECRGVWSCTFQTAIDSERMVSLSHPI